MPPSMVVMGATMPSAFFQGSVEEVYEHEVLGVSLLDIHLVLSFFSPGATTPIGGCILQPSSGL